VTKTLVFGGPGLPPDSRTWFYDLTQELEGEPLDYGITHAYPGDSFPADQVKDAETYVARGMARFVEGPGVEQLERTPAGAIEDVTVAADQLADPPAAIQRGPAAFVEDPGVEKVERNPAGHVEADIS
jgi:hypothetical protein